jgi:hypothetical protein
MGLNVSLNDMFGRQEICCPCCAKPNSSCLDDFDIEAYEIKDGMLSFPTTCIHCEKEFRVTLKFSVQELTSCKEGHPTVGWCPNCAEKGMVDEGCPTCPGFFFTNDETVLIGHKLVKDDEGEWMNSETYHLLYH